MEYSSGKGQASTIKIHGVYLEPLRTAILFAILVINIILLNVMINESTKRKVRRQHRRKQLNIPKVSWSQGPVKIPWLDGLYTPFKLRNEGVKMLEDLAHKYGPIFEIPFGQIKVVGVADVAVIKKVLTSTSPGHLNKPRYIYDKLFENALNFGLLVEEHNTWSFHRGIANRAFTYKNLQNYLKIMNSHATKMMKKIHEKCDKDSGRIQMEDVNKFLDFHGLGIIAEALWGPMCYSDDINQNAQHNIHRAKELTLYRFLHPELFIECLWTLHPKKWELDRLWNKFTQAVTEIIDVYKSVALIPEPENDEDIGEKPVRCMIQEMLLCGAMSNDEILSEILTFLVAGFETTMLTINTLLFHLALNPKVQAKCHQELDDLMNEKQTCQLSMEDLSNLKYMERCILENLRLTAPVPAFSRRLDVPLKINEQLEFNRGQVILILPWVLHRDPLHFPDPMKFDPERFLPENVKERDPYSFIPFSGGPRNCLGRKFALMEIKVLVATILRDFEIFTSDRLDDITFYLEASLRPHRAIRIWFKPRNKNVVKD